MYEDECYDFDDIYFNSASETDEDWFYKSCKSYNGSTFDGFVCAGYSSSYRIREDGICQESDSPNTKRDVGWRAKVAKVDPKGKVVWYKDYGELFSELYSIIQGSDGYYYAVGRSHDFDSSVLYNKGSNQQYISGNFILENPRASTRHVYIIKIAPNGDLVWQYIYGPYDTTYYAEITRAMGFDIIEASPLKFKAVGFSQECVNSIVGQEHPFIIEIDSSGTLLWKELYTSIYGRALAIDEREYTSSGNTVREYTTVGFMRHVGDNTKTDGMAFKINDSANPTAQNLTRIVSDTLKSTVAYD